MSSAWQYISAIRFEAPITLVGLTALSVEISTIADAPAARAASATWRVPTALVSSPSSGFASTIGTCFSAAAWNTSSGRASSKIGADARLVADVGDAARRATSGWVSASSRSICHSAYSPLSSRMSCAGPKRGDLAGELAADRAAGAGDDHAPALDQPRHALAVERHLRPVQQVLDGDRRSSTVPPARAAGAARSGGGRGGPAGHAPRRAPATRQRSRRQIAASPPPRAGQPILLPRAAASTAAASVSVPRIGAPWMRRPICARAEASRPTTRSAWRRSCAKRAQEQIGILAASRPAGRSAPPASDANSRRRPTWRRR